MTWSHVLIQKKEIEARYQELLKRANTVEDILKIEEQIGKFKLRLNLQKAVCVIFPNRLITAH